MVLHFIFKTETGNCNFVLFIFYANVTSLFISACFWHSLAIEVADFDFTNNNELEYKTFKERLAEAIHNAFNKPEDFSEEDSYNEAPSTSNKKYGSMQ